MTPRPIVLGVTEEIYLLHSGALTEYFPHQRMRVPARTHGTSSSSIGARAMLPLAAGGKLGMTTSHATVVVHNPWYLLQLSAEGMKTDFPH